ncbi:MmcQ/YjbR family DNA-binding protein [Kibdelosporangium aridum]|uniref:MmcQ/YjbR family DNA-binding protein n=1 Tax=Kibdelosporangium aridum TaxID=2030 RepID=A0A428ZS51_KIBAR|nr:MmcQ/YjbR family DNA-binding protein [Kibdelosporangium aridum]RSM90821.1 MmcQ/YjbR family DNA-binding protein [Kibdelosporangium aridum]
MPGRTLGVGVAVHSDEFHRIVDGLTDVERSEASKWTSFSVHGKKFGYYWPRTQTVGLKQTISEQLALVAERPDVFEEQFTSGGYGWVVVYLERIEADELSELVYEAWRLTAPDELVEALPFKPVAKSRTRARKSGTASRRSSR